MKKKRFKRVDDPFCVTSYYLLYYHQSFHFFTKFLKNIVTANIWGVAQIRFIAVIYIHLGIWSFSTDSSKCTSSRSLVTRLFYRFLWKKKFFHLFISCITHCKTAAVAKQPRNFIWCGVTELTDRPAVQLSHSSNWLVDWLQLDDT